MHSSTLPYCTHCTEGVEVQLHSLLPSALDVCGWPVLQPNSFATGESFRCSLNERLSKLQSSCEDLPGLEPRFFGHSARILVIIPTEQYGLQKLPRSVCEHNQSNIISLNTNRTTTYVPNRDSFGIIGKNT